MEGLFVNKSQLCIISKRHKDVSKYDVSCAKDGLGEHLGYINVKNNKHIHMVLDAESELDGFYDGDNCITWNDGSKWYRLVISKYQTRQLSYRPYIPLTLVFFSLMYSMIRNIYDKTRGKIRSVN